MGITEYSLWADVEDLRFGQNFTGAQTLKNFYTLETPKQPQPQPPAHARPSPAQPSQAPNSSDSKKKSVRSQLRRPNPQQFLQTSDPKPQTLNTTLLVKPRGARVASAEIPAPLKILEYP